MSTRFRVVINHEEQYSVVSADQPLGRGWKDTGKVGSDADCLKYIEEVWTDMRVEDLQRIKAGIRR